MSTTDTKARDREQQARIVEMMRLQRNEFLRRPKAGSLGAKHSAETRKAMACLLDWYIREYRK